MKIAIVTDRVYPFFKGGAEKRYWEIAKRLRKKGNEIHFFTGQWPRMKKEMIIEGIHLHCVYEVKSFYVNGKKSIKESIIYMYKLFPYLLKHDYDLIECEQFPILSIFSCKLAAVIKRKPLIVTWHEAWSYAYWIEYIGLKGVLGYLLDRSAVVMANKIISVSSRTTRRLRRNPFIKNRILTVKNGVDEIYIKKVVKSKKASDVIFAGRLLTHKNVDILLKSIAIIKRKFPLVKVLIIGNGPELNKLQNIAARLSLKKNVEFINFLHGQYELYSLMKSSKVFVLPSTREGFGILVLEANICGLPVIAIKHKDNAASDLIIESKNGFLIDLGAKQIAEKIAHILNNNIKIDMRYYSKKMAKDYSWNTSTAKIEAFYSSFIS